MNVLSPSEVRSRIDWARRRGLRYWLWPDIDPEARQQALGEIAEAVRRILAGERAAKPLDGDLTALSLTAYTCGLGPLLGHWVETGEIAASPDAAILFKTHLTHNRERNRRLKQHAVKAVSLLASAGLRPLIIKGLHTAFAYFPSPDVRPVSDIDIVVAPETLRDAEAALARAGYVPHLHKQVPYQCDWTLPDTAELPKTLLYVHEEDPWAIDLQTMLDRYLLGWTLNRRTVVPLDRIRPMEALPAWPLSAAADVLGQPLLALQLAAHISESRRNVTLIRLVELIGVIRKDAASGALSWAAFESALKRIGPRFVYPALTFCERLAPSTIPPSILALCEADAPWLLRRFIARQTFATLQGLERHSLTARYMWADGWLSAASQVFHELLPPPGVPLALSKLPSVYFARLSGLFHLGR